MFGLLAEMNRKIDLMSDRPKSERDQLSGGNTAPPAAGGKVQFNTTDEKTKSALKTSKQISFGEKPPSSPRQN